MTDLSLITSIYRSEAFLNTYLLRADRLVQSLKAAAIQCQIVVVANEASRAERELLEEAASRFSLQILHVPRESLYASWNRGVEAAAAPYLGFWNVDDIRYAEALTEGLDALKAGADVVDFPYEVINRVQSRPWNRRHVTTSQFNPDRLTPKSVFGPFFIFSRLCYEKLGPFDADFRVAGDLEWTARAMGRIDYIVASHLGGSFFIHGMNLSGTYSVQETIEVNTILMRYGAWDEVRPTPDSEAMQRNWEAWGNEGRVDVPESVAHLLWGANAYQQWEMWHRERQRRMRGYFLRTIPRTLINRSGLRPLLARLGLVQR